MNSKWIKGLNVRLETIKLLGENISRTLFDVDCSSISWNCLLRHRKIHKWDLIKLKRFCIAKETTDKMKR